MQLMPKRIVDGEGLWRSDKIAAIRTPWMKAEFANLIPLALANGAFEVNARRIWSAVYAYNRAEVTLEMVEQLLEELERVKLLFRWTDLQTQKPWGFWVGINKPGRLPGRSRRGRNEAVGPEPPADELRKFLDSNGIPSLPNGNAKLPGCGIGSSFGSGVGNPFLSEAEAASDEPRTPSRPKAVSSQIGVRLANLLKDEILKNNPKARISPAQVMKWAHEADLMLRVDERSESEIGDLICWSQRDPFWKANVLSMSKLREKFDQLVMKQKQGEGAHGRASSSAETILRNLASTMQKVAGT
jgi:hypothetical protein